jgi:uncharacterized protein YbjT (DUF2867 family)
MKIKAIIFGATGMIGQGVLLECLEDPRVESVLAIGRKSTGKSHPKLKEVLHQDFEDYSAIEDQLQGYNACFYCLGVSAAGMSEEQYHRITYDFSVKAAAVLSRLNPDMTFSFISGAGTDATEKGSTMWARVKGKAENAVQKFPFKATYMFRPGYIQPMKGVTSATRSYRIMYAIFKPFYFLLKGIPKYVTSSVKLGQAMINAADFGYEKTVLESTDINLLAERSPQNTATHA